MPREIREILKEFVADIDDLDHPVKGRISKIIGAERLPYYWEISHHCKPTESAGGVYYPSVVSADTLEEAENNLMAYMESFTTIGVVKNKNY